MKIARFRTEAGREAFLAAYARAMQVLPPASLCSDVETRFGTVRAYTWHGERPCVPVLLLPGQGVGAPMWADNLPDLLASGRTVLAVDALGDAGMSVQTAPLRSVADSARWVEEVLDGLGHSRVHSVGHSFGGGTAAHHAVLHPERVASLALLEPAFTLRWPPVSTLAWAALTTLPVPASWREHALAAIGGVQVEDVRASTPVGDLIVAATAAVQSALPTPRPLTRAQLASLRMPTYVAIASHRSLAGGRRAAAAAERDLPDGTVEVWPDTTHSLPMQVHDELACRLRAFWDEAERGTTARAMLGT